MGNRDDDSLIISAIRNPTKAVQLAGESFRRNIKEIADKQFPLPFDPSQIDLANRKINWRAGQKEKLANDAVSFAVGNNPAMMLSVLKHLPETEFSKAHALAQKNAALPVEQGGLGLHPDNTAMERARALGFDVDSPVYKGMYPYDWTKNPEPEIESISRTTPFPAFNNGEGGVNIAGFVSPDTNIASHFAQNNGAVYPLLINKGKNEAINASGKLAGKVQFGESGKPFRDRIRKGDLDSLDILNTKDEGSMTVMLNPKNIRSRFAAFDPLKKNSANILAGAALGSTLLEKDKKRKDK